MNHGLSEKTVKQIFSVFEGFPEIEKAVLYGSRAKGNFKTGSDIDLTLYGEKLSARLLGDIAEALDDLLLPYTIDLSIFDDLNHAKLREHIERVGVVFYEKKKQNMKAGWEIKTLGDICEEVFAGGDVPKDSFSKTKTEKFRIPIYSNGEKNKGLFGYTDKPRISKTSITISARGTIGYSEIRTEPFYPVVRLIVVVPKNDILDLSFLHFVISSIDFTHSGSSIPQLTVPMIKEYKIPLPSLPEQKRIVTLLDEAFESIATAKANAEQNLKNARALFESHLNEVFTKRGEGWEVKPLSHFASTVSTGPFGSLLHKSDYVSEGVPLVNPINIVNGKIIPNEDKLIDESTKQRLQNYVLQEGDVILGRRGEIGRCAVVDVEQAGWICGTGCFFIRPLETISPAFLAGLIRSSGYREQLENASTGATMLNLSNKALSDLSIAVPTLAEQQTLLKKLDVISEETQRLEALYSRKIAALDELKKALFHRAFSGEL